MKSLRFLLPALLALAWCPAAPAADKAQVQSHYQSYYKAGKAVVTMTLSKKIDAAELEKQVNIMVAAATWFIDEYATAYPQGAQLLKTVTANVDTMRKLSFENLEKDWHDLAYFDQPGHNAGLDLKAEENEHFTDPIHSLVHPLLVLKAAESFANGKKDDDLKKMKEEMEEGLEQAEKLTIALTKK